MDPRSCNRLYNLHIHENSSFFRAKNPFAYIKSVHSAFVLIHVLISNCATVSFGQICFDPLFLVSFVLSRSVSSAKFLTTNP